MLQLSAYPYLQIILKQNILLDIFSTDIVESVGISKTFESQNYADFAEQTWI
jgi:hypothetical protein